MSVNGFNEAMKDFEADYPNFASYGWGPSVHAEIWNGRHAMFGWVVLCATAYAKGHGMFVDPDTLLTYKEWGALATLAGDVGDKASFISNERATVLFANAHALAFSLAATLAPSPWVDPLFLDKSTMEGEIGYERAVARNAQPFGVFPKGPMGLTDTAELMNGRMAMLGLIAVCSTAAIEGKPILDVVNEWVGGAYY